MRNNKEYRKSIVNSYKWGHPSAGYPTAQFIEHIKAVKEELA